MCSFSFFFFGKNKSVVQKTIFFTGFLLIGNFIFSQTVPQPTNILPPSPEAFSIAKYGGINVGLQTGTPQVEIPLYTLKSKNLSLPISLSYASNGIKVDEIASREGTSWILNAGGVISRLVIDDPDELAMPLVPPNDFMTQDAALMTYLQRAVGGNDDGWDNSPDIFSFNFNGYSGKFIFNAGNVVLISKANLRIESSLISRANTGWSFKITDPQGIVYYFNASESSKNNAIGTESCGKTYAGFVTNSWYLSKIVHPDGDAIEFTYQPCEVYSYAVGVSQTSTKFAVVPQTPCSGTRTCYSFPFSECKALATVNAVYLSQIKTSENAVVKFTYTGRSDLPKDYLLENVLIFAPTDAVTPVKSFKLSYYYATANATNTYSSQDPTLTLRPFLKQVQEFNKEKTSSLNYSLDYINTNDLAPRLSFDQDHYGYYNGAHNNQLLTKPKGYENLFSDASANREPNFSYAQMGMLSKITYPTGGYDEFTYDAASAYVTEPSATEQTISASTTGADFSTAVTVVSQDQVNMLFDQEAKIGASFQYVGPPEQLDYHAHTVIEVYNTVTNAVVYTTTLNSDNPRAYESVSLSKNNKYKVRVTSYGQYTIGSGVLHFTEQALVSYNKPMGGVVISQINSYDPVAQKSIVKKLFYNRLGDPGKSSGVITFSPVYVTDLNYLTSCGLPCYTDFCRYKVLSSAPANNLYVFSQHHIYYSSVIESFGANYENGGIEHLFEIAPDQPGDIKLGSDILSSPLSNFGARNGLEVFRNTFKYKNGNVVPLTQTRTTYKDDARLKEQFYGYTVQKKYENSCFTDPPQPYEFLAFDAKKHYILSRWIYADTVEIKNFDENGFNPVLERTVYNYDNTAHLMQTQVSTVTSKGESRITKLKYPQDIDKSTLDASSATAIDLLINRHSTGVVIQSEEYKNSLLLSVTRTNYQDWGNGIVKPKNIQYQQLSGPMEAKVFFNQYNSFGKLQEQQKSNDVKEVYLWGYNGQYPVAKIVGSDYATVKQYINQAVLDDPNTTDAQMRAALQNLRTSLPNALITTFTYAPIIGITSETNVNNRTTYHEYDGFGRLKLSRDHDGNIIKTFKYNYKQ